MSFTVIIPARYHSSRLPGKPLADIKGQPMVVHVMQQALSSGAARVIIATDHEDVVQAVQNAGGEACLTRVDHESGTERLAEVIERYGFTDDSIIVNVQGDEPLIPPAVIRQVADTLCASEADMATLAVPIESLDEAFNPNVVKVVVDADGYALYFSRAAIPWERERFSQMHKSMSDYFLRHIGIYAYRAGFVRRYVHWPPSQLERIELLEQLRVLWYGKKIQVAVADFPPPGALTRQRICKEYAISCLHCQHSRGLLFIDDTKGGEITWMFHAYTVLIHDSC